MKTWIMALCLAMPAAAEDPVRLTMALSADMMVLHDKRFEPPLLEHLKSLQKETNAKSFRVVCMGEKAIRTYEDTRPRVARFEAWFDDAKFRAAESCKIKKQTDAAFESSVALETRLFEAQDGGKEIMVILDLLPCQRQGEVPGPEMLSDPQFALAIPEGGDKVPLRGDAYWYFSRAGLENSLGNLLDGRDPAAKEREIERCRMSLARLWATYLRSKGFRLMAFDAAVPGEGRSAPSLAATLQTDRGGKGIAPYDPEERKKPLPPVEPSPAKPTAERPAPESIRVFIEWQGQNVVLPVYRGKGDGKAVFPPAANEIPDESQRQVFKTYRTFATEGAEEIEIRSGPLRYRRAMEGLVTHCRELEIPVGENGRIKGKLQLYLYDGKVRSAEGFKVYVRKGDRKSAPFQTLIFRNVEGRREGGRGSDSDSNCWKTIELNN